jgi:hypothetical protein
MFGRKSVLSLSKVTCLNFQIGPSKEWERTVLIENCNYNNKFLHRQVKNKLLKYHKDMHKSQYKDTYIQTESSIYITHMYIKTLFMQIYTYNRYFAYSDRL